MKCEPLRTPVLGTLGLQAGEDVRNAMHGNGNDPWPVKIRTDFTDKFEEFAKWADKSGGFEIW